MASLDKTYIVVGFGLKKDTKEPYSRAALYRTDVRNGEWAFVDFKECIYLDEIREVGEFINTTTQIA